MLKINLLPIRQLKKRAKAINQIFSAFVALCCVIAALCLIMFYQSNTVKAIERDIASWKIEEKTLKRTLDKIAQFEKNTEELNRRIDIINGLKKESSLTVHILDEVANLIDNKRVWLVSFSQQGSTLNLDGVAMDNETIAQFMNLLETSAYISNVSLGKSTLKGFSGRNLKSFNLKCVVGHPQKEKKG